MLFWKSVSFLKKEKTVWQFVSFGSKERSQINNETKKRSGHFKKVLPWIWNKKKKCTFPSFFCLFFFLKKTRCCIKKGNTFNDFSLFFLRKCFCFSRVFILLFSKISFSKPKEGCPQEKRSLQFKQVLPRMKMLPRQKRRNIWEKTKEWGQYKKLPFFQLMSGEEVVFFC